MTSSKLILLDIHSLPYVTIWAFPVLVLSPLSSCLPHPSKPPPTTPPFSLMSDTCRSALSCSMERLSSLLFIWSAGRMDSHVIQLDYSAVWCFIRKSRCQGVCAWKHMREREDEGERLVSRFACLSRYSPLHECLNGKANPFFPVHWKQLSLRSKHGHGYDK